MSRSKTLKQSLITSHIVTGLLPMAAIALLIVLFYIKAVRDDFSVRIDTLAQGTRGQIQLFMDQPLSVLSTIGEILRVVEDKEQVQRILNSHLRDSVYFEGIYLLNQDGIVINAGLPPQREQQRIDLVGISLGHKDEFRAARNSGEPQWSNTFLSLSSGKISLTLYIPVGTSVLAADINLDLLAGLLNQLSRDKVMVAVIDRNGAIIIHPDLTLITGTVMMNDVSLVSTALTGVAATGEFTFQGRRYLGSTSIIEPTGWVCLFAEPADLLSRRVHVVLFIFTAGICGAAALSLALAVYKTRGLAAPISEITARTAVIARGDYGESLPKGSFVELGQLADSINEMAGAIQNRESLLRASELKYRELIENTSNLVLRLEHDLTISYANHTLARLTGIAPDQATGVSLATFVVDADQPLLRQAADTWLREKLTHATLEIRFRHQDLSTRILLLTANLHYDETQQLVDITIIGHDITSRLEMEQQRQEMERQRQQSQKMEMLGLMAGGVAHDLNNILAGIINYPELLLLKLPSDSPLRTPIEAMKRSGERAAAVVADLLTVARGSAAVHELVDINRLVNDFIHSPDFEKLCELYPEIDFSSSPCETRCTCRCSPIHIEKALMNLVINAFEAVKATGRVDLACESIDESVVTELVPELKPGRYLRLTVTDTGTGIDPDHLKKVFEPFFSKKGMGRSGTGLGLTVAWSTAREHGGTITVASDAGGSTFSLYLPASDEHYLERLPDEQSIASLLGRRESILVIDDEEHLRHIAVRMLEELNYQAAAVASGEEALAYLENTPADLLLLDMQMAPGISGRETYERVCSSIPEQKAVVVSGFSTSSDVEATLKRGASGFLKKPYSLTELGQAVKQALRSAGG